MTRKQLMRIWPLVTKWVEGAELEIRVDYQGIIHWEDLEEDELPINNMAEFPDEYRIKQQKQQAMTREEAKIILPFVTALAEGRQIQTLDVNSGDWEDIDEITVDYFLSHQLDYRIKPEPTYRPFKDGAECLEEMQKHKPFSGVSDKASPNRKLVIIGGFDECISLSRDFLEGPINYDVAYRELDFADGTPFGMKDE